MGAKNVEPALHGIHRDTLLTAHFSYCLPVTLVSQQYTKSLYCAANLVSAGELYLIGSIYDFIVMNRMFFALPDKRILIDPYWSLYQHLTALYLFILSFSSVLLSVSTQQQCKQNPFNGFNKRTLFTATHYVLQFIAIAMSIFCCDASMKMSFDVARFAFDADPPEFQRACYWYLIRLRASAMLYGASAIMDATICVVTCLLGKYSRYISLTQHHSTSC